MEPTQPQDHLAPQDQRANPDSPFPFTHRGVTYELAAPSTVVDVGWARTNRHKSELEQLFLIIEALAGPEALAAIDSMNSAEFLQFQKALMAHAGVKLGELQAS